MSDSPVLIIVAFAVALVLGASTGCAGSQRAAAYATLDASARASELWIAETEERYRSEQMAAVAESTTLETAQARVIVIRHAYEPIWSAWRLYRAAWTAALSLVSADEPDSATLERVLSDLAAAQQALQGAIEDAGR